MLIINVIICIIVITLRIMFDFTDHNLVSDNHNDLEQIDKLEYIEELPYVMFLLLPFIALFTISLKLPNFDDNIFIAREMRMVIFVLTLILIAFVIQEVIEDTRGDKDENLQIVLNILYYVVIESCNFISMLITTKYVMDKVHE